MYDHERTNRIIAWAVGGFAFIMYMLTTAPVVAFWDNGEFIAVGYTLGVGHPPGSPVYTLISRLFSILPFANPAQAVNFESVVAASMAIFFLYLAMAKMARRWEGKVSTFEEGLPTYVAGVTACVFAAFSFSFWENALEAEVYATNMLVMTSTLWMVLRWSEVREVPRERRYLYFVIYLLALGVGVHMGCLLWAPAFLLFIIFFERNYVGVIFLGVPLLMGFILLSKGIELIRGPIPLWLMWLGVTAFYAIPALWPEPKRAKGKKAKAAVTHPAVMPFWLIISIVIVELIGLFSTMAAHGGPGALWFAVGAAVSAGSVFVFVRMLRSGLIDRPEIPARIVLASVALGALALSVHAYLLIRARLNPAINESDPDTWGKVLDVMRRKQYEPMRFFPRRTPFSNQFRILWGYFRIQFPVFPRELWFASIPSFAMAVWGAIAHVRRDRRTAAMMLVAFLISSVGLLFYMNISDHEVRSREYFWVPAYVGLALWMGLGSGAIVDWAKKMGTTYRNVMIGAVLLFSAMPIFMQHHTMDRSDNYVAYYYGWNMINFLEEDAIIITNGDNDTFPLWYLQQVEGIRTDVDIVNLSLIQINWYIEQLKDRGVPMSFTYDEIERMTPYWTRDPDTGELSLVSLRDITLHDIIRENNWERPIYFAVTVDDFLGYYDNLELEGMVFRLKPERGRHLINVERTYENVFENYRYDSLIDVDDGWRVMDEIYKPPTTARLVTNYAAGFSRLGYDAMQQTPTKTDEAIRLYELALKFAPEYGPALNGLIAIYAVKMMQPERALPLAERLLQAQPERLETWIRYGGVHLMIAEGLTQEGSQAEAQGHFESAIWAYEEALAREPDRRELYPPLLSMYQKLNMTRKLNSLLDLWGRYYPEDIQRMMESGSLEGGPGAGE
jgi:tetratricopeptide (TPR) repeat protein